MTSGRSRVGTLGSLRALAGDALVALGEVMRGADDAWPSEYYRGGRMECDGPDQTWPAPIPRAEVRSAIDELPDSSLLNIAATVIAGWKPILLRDHIAALTDVDVLVDALHDRAALFAAIEDDAEQPFLTPVNLSAHLTRSASTRPE